MGNTGLHSIQTFCRQGDIPRFHNSNERQKFIKLHLKPYMSVIF
ncbi:Hypothetical protein EAG7_05247 [Klebsiella aerogenes]|nr:Hypothetical protein EAG7_05247 [Klebsiella aerogenes]CCG33744.1 hypothetical protein [Klebsiella aerogenes EA1509E]